MLGRRLMLLMAVLLGLTALATALAPRPRVDPQQSATPQPAPTATPRPAVVPEQARVVERTLEAEPERPVVVRASVGDTVRLVVRGDILDSVEIEGLAEIEQVEPDSPALFELRAEEPASHEIRLIDADKRIGRLVIG